MNPPTEQLIRDYLNRLSVAARTKLGFRDRQALLDRTRMQIELDCGGPSTASAAQVRKALAGLGDPMALVESEHARIAAGSQTRISPGGAAGGQRRVAMVNHWQFQDPAATSSPPAAASAAAGSSIPAASAAAPAPNGASAFATVTGAASGEEPPSRLNGVAGPRSAADVPGSAPGSDPAQAAEPSPMPGAAESVPRPRAPEPAAAGTAEPAALEAAESALSLEPGESATALEAAGSPMSAPVSEPADKPGSEPPPDAAPESGSSSLSASAAKRTGSARRRSRPPAAGDPAEQPATPGRVSGLTGAAGGVIWRFADATAVLARRRPLESAAVVLMGVGGAIFPPIWLLGAGFAMPSKAWDLRDKWIGLVTPILLVLAGSALVVVLGGEHHSLAAYAFEAWLSVGRISRIVAVLGASYLLWRLWRGPRNPRQPPWNTPRQFG